MIDLNKLRDKIHANAKSKGFYSVEEDILKWNLNSTENLKHAFFAQKIALIHSELSEALEADRKGHWANIHQFLIEEDYFENEEDRRISFEANVKNSVEDEMADILFRILDLCGWFDIDIQKHVELKMYYNSTREYRHGKNY